MLTAIGVPVTGADDVNYAAVMGTVNIRDLVIEQASWILLNVPASVIPDATLALRTTGLLLAILSTWLMTRPSMGRYGLAMFAVSVFPLYIVLYFAQIRFLLAFVIFATVFSYPRFRLLAGPASLAGHLTGVLMACPAIIVLVAPFLGLASYLDPTNIVALKLSAYLGAEYFDRPFYFGWELAGIALIYLFNRRFVESALVAITLLGVYLISDALGVIVARRLLELAILAFSPLLFYLKARQLPPKSLIAFYVALGVFQTGAALAAGVVRLG